MSVRSTNTGLMTACLLAALAGCSVPPPDCPVEGPGESAPSAGCFAVSGGGLLLVRGFDGRVSLPGGSSEPGESARCTAFRETWEETGLRLVPGELLRVFDTGFHLYRCRPDQASGQIDPPFRLEVRDVFFLAPDLFAEYQWRFGDQRRILRDMLLEEADGAGGG